jgi:hypothetical protein
MAIVHTLPTAHPELAVTAEDTCVYLEELLAKDALSDTDVRLWSDLVRALGRPQTYTAAVSHCIRGCIGKHRALEEQWEQLNRPQDSDWEAEERRRQEKYERRRAARFAAHRESFAKAEAEIAAGIDLGALHNLALGYLDRYADLDSDAAPEERLRKWVGDDVAEAARKGFIAVLKRNDLPTIDQIVAIRSEGKHWTVEPVMMCGVAELVRTGRSLDCLSDKVAKAVLAIWWEMPEFGTSKLGEDIASQLEARVFTSAVGVESFLISTIEPQIWAGRDHVSGLYRLSTDAEFKDIAAALALRWLKAVSPASLAVQHELVLICLHRGMPASLVGVVRNRLIDLSKSEDKFRRLWVAAAFIVDLPEFQETVGATAQTDGSLLWAIRDLIRPDRFGNRQLPLNIAQLEFIVERFSPLWSVASAPSSGWSGDTNPWDATEFINSCIDELGTIANTEASSALDRLASTPSVAAYANRVKHVRTEQRRLRRDREYVPPSFQQVKRTLASGPPGTIDDLKALMMDALFSLQDYIRNSDTDGWEAYWLDGRPKVENTCRDRILDALRLRVSKDVDLLPESLMPEKRRTDILAIHDGKGLPIEVKGQWHRNVWNASATQLKDEHSRDWRADGRGIYLVLWVGHVSQKQLPRHPDGLPPPQSPTELRVMLQNRLDDGERRRIEVFVLDICRPPGKN